MGTLFELFGSIGTLFLSFTKNVTDKEIEKKIKFLEKHQWFQNYLNDVQFENLIKTHKDVRYIIGKFNIEKMKTKDQYHRKYQKKIHKVLLKNLN